jgi:hypothetical protein
MSVLLIELISNESSHGTFWEHSFGAKVGGTLPRHPVARVGTVYSAKRMIECKMVAILHSIYMYDSFSLFNINQREKKEPLKKVS